VDSAVLIGIDRLWKQALQSTVLIDDTGNLVNDVDGSKLTLERLAHLSLTWLVLHELMHIRLGHLDLLGSAQLVETESDESVDGFWQRDEIADIANVLSSMERKLFRPCLELQADNEATEMMFGVFAESEWGRFRIEAAAIFVVMALMEKADVVSSDGTKTYPRVATRFFTLFAQLFQYWLYPGAELKAGDRESFVNTPRKPQGKDFERYMKFVLAFAINDAVQIALWAEAKTFLTDLGEGSALFKDIFEIQYAKDLGKANLNTNAAIEWRELLPVNEKIMAASGLRG
ncbi:MAG: hypothetical protein GY761_07005, partial [Hyphomicrobiales bacterium]|nr:hypothetical protein [Hyphomicrobiales bacterium]